MNLFPLHFRAHVMPKLRAAVDVQSFFIACGVRDYAEARQAVLDIAIGYGAAHLPRRWFDPEAGWIDPFDTMLDWISTALCRGIDAAEKRVEAIEAAMATVDQIQHYEDLAARSQNPEAMRWTFAAICPEYRAHLLREKRSAK